MDIGKIKKAVKYILKNNLKVLCFLVVLSLCSAMRYAAIGKYAIMLSDTTQVVAGESFFASNYLKQVDSASDITYSNNETRQNAGNSSFYYSIGSWNKYERIIPVEIRNYNNVKKYNKEDEQNIYFYVDVKFYKDKECQNEATDWQDITNIGLGYEVDYQADIKDGVATAYGKVGKITIGAICYPVSLLKGGKIQTQKLNIKVSTKTSEDKVPDELFVRVTANIVKASDFSKIKFDNRNDGVDVKFNNKATTSGIFYSMLGGLFSLGSSGATADITCTPQNNTSTLQVGLKVACSSMEFQSSAKGRIYFNPNKLECTGSETVVEIVPGSAEESDRDAFKASNYPSDTSDWSAYSAYIEFDLETGRAKTINFVKNTEEDFSTDYYKFGVKKAAEE